ncbi:MAG TPA: RNA polymerase sigma factor, partial [Polyangiales bacterium]|nr:RNA polymerase sigma factor [Polyangiales bacterium]
MTQASELVADAVLRRAAQGDRAAQQQVLSEIYEFVRRTLYRLLLGRGEELEDLQQAALLRVLTSLGNYRFEAAFKTWVTAICINVFRDHLRRKRREPQLERGPHALDDDRLAFALTSTEPSAHRQVEAREALNRCARILEAMPINQRTAFVLQAVHGHSIEEIAQLMDSANSTTRLRLYYARKAFRKAFALAVA